MVKREGRVEGVESREKMGESVCSHNSMFSVLFYTRVCLIYVLTLF